MKRCTVPLLLVGILSSCTRPPAPPATPESAVDSSAAAPPTADPCAAPAGPDRPEDCPRVQPAAAGVSPEELAATDSDGDHIDDLIDRCPDEPEDFDGVEDDDGCPDLEPPPRTSVVPTSIQAEQHPPRLP
jgi:hypothetical protein